MHSTSFFPKKKKNSYVIPGSWIIFSVTKGAKTGNGYSTLRLYTSPSLSVGSLPIQRLLNFNGPNTWDFLNRIQDILPTKLIVMHCS